MEVVKVEQKMHFVLVHGACHGAWSWYKVKPRLESSGHGNHQVTVVDTAASGVNMKAIHDVHSFHEYSEPLLNVMASLSPNEKVVLVGHSLGGLCCALAMDMFPDKVSVAVFLTAFLPDTVHRPSYVVDQDIKFYTVHRPSYVVDQYCERASMEAWMDTQFLSYGSSSEPLTSMFFGPKFMSSKLYQLCPIEDFELAMTLTRPGSLFREDLYKAKKFSDEDYGSVKRVYVVCNEDEGTPEEFQRWMITNGGVKDVMEIEKVDHMAMLSKPQELCNCLLEIANKYS